MCWKHKTDSRYEGRDTDTETEIEYDQQRKMGKERGYLWVLMCMFVRERKRKKERERPREILSITDKVSLRNRECVCGYACVYVGEKESKIKRVR